MKSLAMKNLSMKSLIGELSLAATLTLLLATSIPAHAQEPSAETAVERVEVEEDDADGTLDLEVETAATNERADRESERRSTRYRWRSREDNVIVNFGGDSFLAADDWAQAVVSLFGSSTTEGEVYEAVVSVFGDTRVTGPVREDAVAVFGDMYVDSVVGNDVVAVFGDVELGPNAEIDGQVIAVGGAVIRDSGAIIEGGVQNVAFGTGLEFGWLHAWIDHALLYGRPLAIEPGLGWAWAIALGFLAFYILLAILLSEPMERCVTTLEKQPGQSALAALLAMVLTPLVFILLLITVLGIALIPFVGLALFALALFGKAVMLAWLGRIVTRGAGEGPFARVAFPVLVGGIIVLALYLVPVLGFIVYKLLGILGLGVVLYTILLALQSTRTREPPPAFAAATPEAAPHAGAESAANFSTSSESASTASSTAEPTPTSSPAPMLGAAASQPRAGFWIRMAALAIDAVIVGVITSILEPPGEIWLLALAGYGALMWKLKSTTIGGIVCNLQVVRVDGREIDWDTAIVRALSCFLSLAAAGLGFLWIAFDPQRQSWHDKIAGTVVVRTPQREAAASG